MAVPVTRHTFTVAASRQEGCFCSNCGLTPFPLTDCTCWLLAPACPPPLPPRTHTHLLYLLG